MTAKKGGAIQPETKDEAIELNKKIMPATKENFDKAVNQEGERIKILQDKNLLINIVKEVQNNGVASEEDTIISIVIVANTRLVKNAGAESKNLMLSDETGVGKDFTVKLTLSVIIPEERHQHYTKMSPESFTYLHYKEDDWTWDNQVIHIEDITQNLLDCSTFKTMASGDNVAVVVIKQKAIEIPINGKPVLITTSHHVNPRDESLRRFPIGGLNASPQQTQNIKNKTAQKYSGRIKIEENEVLRDAIQFLLKAHKVVIPYAEIIQFFFPDDIIMRTHFRRFLDYICSSAVLHQYQREKTPDGELIANADDFMIARMVLIYTTSNPKMIPMSKEYREILEILQNKTEPMTINEILIECDKSKDWLYKNLPNLQTTGLIKISKKRDDQANKEVFTYQYSPEKNPNALPTWNEIGNQIHKIINKTNNTTKTTPPSLLERWFYSSEIKPIIPQHEDGFSLVLFGHNITFNRKVLLVFAVLGSFLKERNSKRYSRYYDDKDESKETEQKELPESKQQTPDQVNEIRQLSDFINTSKNKAGFVKKKSILSFVKCVLKKSNPDNYYNNLLQRGILTFYSGKGVMFTGGET